jgi:hypothetical protein
MAEQVRLIIRGTVGQINKVFQEEVSITKAEFIGKIAKKSGIRVRSCNATFTIHNGL